MCRVINWFTIYSLWIHLTWCIFFLLLFLLRFNHSFWYHCHRIHHQKSCLLFLSLITGHIYFSMYVYIPRSNTIRSWTAKIFHWTMNEWMVCALKYERISSAIQISNPSLSLWMCEYGIWTSTANTDTHTHIDTHCQLQYETKAWPTCNEFH